MDRIKYAQPSAPTVHGPLTHMDPLEWGAQTKHIAMKRIGLKPIATKPIGLKLIGYLTYQNFTYRYIKPIGVLNLSFTKPIGIKPIAILNISLY